MSNQHFSFLEYFQRNYILVNTKLKTHSLQYSIAPSGKEKPTKFSFEFVFIFFFLFLK